MDFKSLKQKSSAHLYALTIDKYFPKKLRNFLRKVVAFFAIASFVASFDNILPVNFGKADSLFLLLIAIYIGLNLLEFFYRSMSHEGLNTRLYESISSGKKIDYCLSEILSTGNEIDITKSLFDSKIGQLIFFRLGIPFENCKNFIFSDRNMIVSSSLSFENEFVDSVTFVDCLYEADKSLQLFLSQNSINKEELLGTVAWIMKDEEYRLRSERFWSRENLGAIPSIGVSWSYGESVDLGKFGILFENTINLGSFDIENGYRKKEVDLLEDILERNNEANAIIINDDEKVSKDIIARFLQRIKLGTAFPTLEHKILIELDTSALIASFKNKTDLENEILKIFNQSVSAGNIIIYINDFSGFISSAKNLGVNIPSIISPFLDSNAVQLIVSVTNSDFHFVIETNATLLDRFERIVPEPAGTKASINAVLEKIFLTENQNKIFFSYPAILNIVNSADRFITYGEMPTKAFDLLDGIVPWAKERKIKIINENDVSVFVSEKTGVEVGVIKEKEAEKIAKLEEILHKRVVGQEEAVSGVANAIRRAKSGITNPKRPMASFLFIGPTGVGKTEVSKTLAESFFGREDKMIRFDMSEYSGSDALPQLIGDFSLNKSGLLARKIKDNPYGVLLLDEFEKASRDVLDLFLQILDEGVFTDALGKQVNCRNLMIIATSNAGSTIIWDTMKSSTNISKSKDFIIDSIIKDKIFKPELLNRFDGIIFFHPLLKKELQEIAKIALKKLAIRLRERNLELVVNDDVVNFLVEKGGDPKFGGRSINRAIQNDIENIIAKKIINGEAKPGSKIEIKKEELI